MSTPILSSHPRRALVASCAFVLVLCGAPSARADDDPMAPYRERFQSGMTHYKASDFAGAVAWWEPIVTALGDEKGYRVAFDLARAYEKLGDAAHARARYEAFVRVVEAKRARGEAIDPVVTTEEGEARAALGPAPLAGTEVTPPVAPSPALGVTPAPTPVPSSAPAPAPATTPASAPAVAPSASRPPPWLLITGGALTVGAGVLCGVEYASALGKKSDFGAAAGQSGAQSAIKSSYDGVRSVAYVSLAATAGLAAITGGLTAWYFASGPRKDGASVNVTADPTPHGAQIGLVGRF